MPYFDKVRLAEYGRLPLLWYILRANRLYQTPGSMASVGNIRNKNHHQNRARHFCFRSANNFQLIVRPAKQLVSSAYPQHTNGESILSPPRALIGKRSISRVLSSSRVPTWFITYVFTHWRMLCALRAFTPHSFTYSGGHIHLSWGWRRAIEYRVPDK